MIGAELHWSAGILPVFDCETTGVDTATARICSVSFVLSTPRGFVQPGGYTAIVNPGCDIPAEAAAIHGITTERAQMEGVPIAIAVEEIITRMQGAYYFDMPLLGMNVGFDWRMIHYEALRLGSVDAIPDLDLIDPYVLDRGLDKFRKGSRKLADLVTHYGVNLDATGAHDARWDCLATAEVFRAQVRRFPEIEKLTPGQLQDVQREFYAEWIGSLSRYRVQRGEPAIAEAAWPGWPPLVPVGVA